MLVTSLAASVSVWMEDSSEVLLSRRAQQLVSEHPRLVVGSYVDSKGISCCLAKSYVDLGAALGLFVGSCVDLKIAYSCSRNQFGGVDCFENSSKVSRGGKDLVFI